MIGRVPHPRTTHASRVPAAGQRLPFFARYACPGARVVDILAQNLASMHRAYCFPPTNMVVLIQHLFGCQTEAVGIMPDFAAAWFPLMQHVCLETAKIADPGDQSGFVCDHHLPGGETMHLPRGG